MISHLRLLRRWVRFMPLALPGLLIACAGDRDASTAEPSFYRKLTETGAQLDSATAASMISGYRANNGLTSVTVDPDLMKLAQAQAQAMASRDKLDHNVVRSFNERLRGQGYRAKAAAENISAGYYTLAEAFSGWRDFSATSSKHAACGRNPHGHCSRVRAQLEIQGFLDAYSRSTR